VKIHILPPDVVNRIAAGEVLDRPANLLKELLENSLDAGATQLDIEVEDGGRRVLVCDNGHGLAPEEMGLALLRHATSKISQSEDLFALQSFGFRGEALASVAAVSRLTLTSRAQGQTQGYRLISEFGQVSDPQPISAAPGTEIRVTDLFSNVPARLKFLKSDASEISQIKTTLKALALANERVGFSIKINGELVFHWPKNQDFQARAMAVLDKGQLFAGQSEVEGVRAEVLVSSPTDVANVNRSLWLFVQGRWIQDRSLVAAIMDGYRNLLMHGEYPTAVVRLTCPTGSVDVNVHPTKPPFAPPTERCGKC
jgi:DNA mismatch repair protein MutL